jgi:hypothetical protein
LDQVSLGHPHYFTGKMSDKSIQLDLLLWKDKELVIRQNQLKGAFWKLFSELGNSPIAKKIGWFHTPNKGIKLTKGNDLLGFPFHVLDLIRDFETDKGLNIRILNWFGHGMFLFILAGKNNLLANSDFYSANGFKYSLSPTPWDYPELIISNNHTENPDAALIDKSTYHQWFKQIQLEETDDFSLKLEEQLKIISDFFNHRMG